MSAPSALIAEDEPLLAAALQSELAHAWPELRVLAIAGDGQSAVAKALELQPDVLFFDIRMPGQGGLDAAAELAEEWPEGKPFPALVFVTAYDQYAVQAFEAQAVDYLLKPVRAERLQKTVDKLRALVAARHGAPSMDAVLAQLRGLLGAGGESTPASAAIEPKGSGPADRLHSIAAGVGQSIHMVRIEDVLYFEAADKYVRVVAAGHEYLIRTPLKELLPRLDPAEFWQIHRGAVVRAASIATVTRDEAGKLSLSLSGRPEKLPVSRLYAHLFKAM